MRLASKRQWRDRWAKLDDKSFALSVKKPMFREKHRVFVEIFDSEVLRSCLEVGAYPGAYLKYFYDYFGCEPWGVEYVEECAKSAEKKLNQLGVPARILPRDFFDLDSSESPNGDGWELTVSFGFVEHFDDPTEAIGKHFDVTRPGGFVAISIPNHHGINGSLLRMIDEGKWHQHNRMSLRDLQESAERLTDAEILYSGYVGRIGFWNVGLYSKIKAGHPKLYPLLRTPLWVLEWVGQWIVPNNRWTSPDCLMILKKREHE